MWTTLTKPKRIPHPNFPRQADPVPRVRLAEYGTKRMPCVSFNKTASDAISKVGLSYVGFMIDGDKVGIKLYKTKGRNRYKLTRVDKSYLRLTTTCLRDRKPLGSYEIHEGDGQVSWWF